MKRKKLQKDDCDWTSKYPLKMKDIMITKKKVTLVSDTFKEILKNKSCMILGKRLKKIKN
jgi:hypothetical protein